MNVLFICFIQYLTLQGLVYSSLDQVFKVERIAFPVEMSLFAQERYVTHEFSAFIINLTCVKSDSSKVNITRMIWSFTIFTEYPYIQAYIGSSYKA